MVERRQKKKAGDVYFRPKDRFYEYLEQHKTMQKETRRKERKGAYILTAFGITLILLAIFTHEKSQYNLISRLFTGG